MGSVVKHIGSALTGHGGGGKQTQDEKSTQKQTSESWLQSNPQYQQLETSALNEANNFNMPLLQQAGMTPDQIAALSKMSQGVDYSKFTNAGNLLTGMGNSAYTQGSNILGGAFNTLNEMGNMSQADYQKLMQNEYNSQLVKDQIAGLTADVQEQEGHSIQALNQQAGAAGGMGNSRAGVAQGVIAGQAAKAIAQGSIQYRTAEESQAFNRLNSYLNQRMGAATSLAGIGQNQQQLGLSAYGQGMNYFNTANQYQLQNTQNQLTAGNIWQSFNQQALDIQRQNQIQAQSPALTRLAYFNQTFLPMANLSTTGNMTGTSHSETITPGQGGNLLGGMLGMAGTVVGGMFGGPIGASIGGSIGGAVGNSFGK